MIITNRVRLVILISLVAAFLLGMAFDHGKCYYHGYVVGNTKGIETGKFIGAKEFGSMMIARLYFESSDKPAKHVQNTSSGNAQGTVKKPRSRWFGKS